MKQIFLFLLLLLSINLTAQRQLPFYNTAAGTLTQVGAGSGYVDVRINYSDQTGMTNGSTLDNTCVLLYFNTDESLGYELPVTSIVTPSSTNPVVRVNITGFPALNGAINGQGVIYKKSSTRHFAPYVSNAVASLQQVIQETVARDIETSLTNATEIYKYVGTTDVLPAVNASVAGATIAQNTVGQISYWNPINNLITGSWSFQGSGTFDTLGYKLITRTQADANYLFKNAKLDSNNLKVRGIQASALSQHAYDTLQAKIDSVGSLIPISNNTLPLVFTLEPYTSQANTSTFTTTTETNNNYFIASGVIGDTFITINTSNVAIAGFGTAGDFVKIKNNIYQSYPILKMNGSTLPFTASIGNKVISSFTNDTFYVMQELLNGQHLTGNGYKGAAQYFYNTPQYKLESGKYIFEYRPESSSTQVYPFTPYGGATNGGVIENGTMNPSYQNINILNINQGRIHKRYLSFCQKGIGKGISATIPINYINSVFEITMGMNMTGTYDVDAGTAGNQAPFGKVTITLLNELGVQIYKDTIYNTLKVIKVPLVDVNILTVKIEALDAYAFDCAINRMVVRYSPNAITPLTKITSGKKGIILGDSWSVFNTNAFATELDRLVKAESTTSNFITVGRGGMTSEWGKYWVDSLVIKNPIKPDYCIVEFFTNDNNSIGTPSSAYNFSATDPYGGTATIPGSITTTSQYVKNIDTIVTKLINAGITPILWIGGHTGSLGQTMSAYENIQSNGYGSGEKYYSLGDYASTPFAEITTQNSDSINVRGIRNDSITTKRIRGFASAIGTPSLKIDVNDPNAANAESVVIQPAFAKTAGQAFVIKDVNGNVVHKMTHTPSTSTYSNGSIVSGIFIANMPFSGGGFQTNGLRVQSAGSQGYIGGSAIQRLILGSDDLNNLITNGVVIPRKTYIGGIATGVSTPAYQLDVDAITGTSGNPIRLQGLQAGATTDSLLSSASGVLRRLSINEVIKPTSDTLRGNAIVYVPSNAGALVFGNGAKQVLIFNPTTTITSFTFSLPNTNNIVGDEISVYVKGNGTPATGIVWTGGAGVIDGTSPSTLNKSDHVKLIWDGTNWLRIIN